MTPELAGRGMRIVAALASRLGGGRKSGRQAALGGPRPSGVTFDLVDAASQPQDSSRKSVSRRRRESAAGVMRRMVMNPWNHSGPFLESHSCSGGGGDVPHRRRLRRAAGHSRPLPRTSEPRGAWTARPRSAGPRRLPGRLRSAQVVVEEPPHVGPLQVVALGESVVALGVGSGVGDRVDERGRGRGDRRACGGHRGQIAAGTVAQHADPPGIDAEPRCAPLQPAERPQGIIGGGRESVFRRSPVIDRDDDGGRVVAERPAEAVVAVEVAEHPAPTVQEQDGRAPAGAGGRS